MLLDYRHVTRDYSIWVPLVAPFGVRTSPVQLVEQYVVRSLLHASHKGSNIGFDQEVIPLVRVGQWMTYLGYPVTDFVRRVAKNRQLQEGSKGFDQGGI
jgi:hypothetical protein